ncbi:MAG: DNA polymerase IV [Planctomycetota bacterium]
MAEGEPSPDPADRTILHVDMDAFFASVEQLDDPSLRGKPVLVGGGGRRGVVAAASYEARAFGCRSAMPTAIARRLCPQAIVVRGNYARYRELSDRVFAILHDHTPLVQPLSIDEAFLDVTGSRRLLGDGVRIARSIRARIRGELGLAASVGVAPTMLVAKIASDLDKPDGLTVIRPGEVQARLDPLPISRLWGVGSAGEARLARHGVRTFADLRRLDLATLETMFGSMGGSLWRRCRGIDDRRVSTDRGVKTISHEQTFGDDLTTREACHAVLVDLSERVAWRLRRAGRSSRVVTVKIRTPDFATVTRSRTLTETTTATSDLLAISRELFDEWPFSPVRLLGVGVEALASDAAAQPGLFDGRERQQSGAVDAVADEIRARYGSGAVRRGSSLG